MAETKYKKLYLRCAFTDAEMGGLATTMADKTQELKRIDSNAKAAAAQFKSDKERAQNEIDDAARKYRDGHEMRDVECEEIVDFESGVVRYWRCDNGDLAQERKLTNEERQMRLDEIETVDNKKAFSGSEEECSGQQSIIDDQLHDSHIASVNRTMAQERAVEM